MLAVLILAATALTAFNAKAEVRVDVDLFHRSHDREVIVERPREVIVERPRAYVVERPVVVETQVTRRWVPDVVERRAETVLVEPARFERVWVPAETEGYRVGRVEFSSTVSAGYWREVSLPARYEKRWVNHVVVPGHYENVTVSAPVENTYIYRR